MQYDLCVLFSTLQLGGPIWMDPIHDVEFVKKLLSEVKSSPKGTYKTIDRITGLLTVVSEVSVRY